MYRKVLNNFKISNEVFAKYLDGKKLVLKTDHLAEISYPVNLAVSLSFPKNEGIISSSTKDILELILNNCSGYNFIYNGMPCNDIEKIIYILLASGSFNTGICTQNVNEYKTIKEEYSLLKNKILPYSCTENRLKEYEDTVGIHKIYLLSYRSKRD